MDSGCEFLSVLVEWREEDRKMPYITQVSPAGLAPDARLLGMRLDAGVDILSRYGWQMVSFQMGNYPHKPAVARQEYILQRRRR